MKHSIEIDYDDDYYSSFSKETNEKKKPQSGFAAIVPFRNTFSFFFRLDSSPKEVFINTLIFFLSSKVEKKEKKQKKLIGTVCLVQTGIGRTGTHTPTHTVSLSHPHPHTHPKTHTYIPLAA